MNEAGPDSLAGGNVPASSSSISTGGHGNFPIRREDTPEHFPIVLKR
jgi:hypothetical protein